MLLTHLGISQKVQTDPCHLRGVFYTTECYGSVATVQLKNIPNSGIFLFIQSLNHIVKFAVFI